MYKSVFVCVVNLILNRIQKDIACMYDIVKATVLPFQEPHTWRYSFDHLYEDMQPLSVVAIHV